MKSWVLSLITFLVCFAVVIFTDIPLWVFLIIFAPLLLVAATYLTVSYSFRESLETEPIPQSGYQSRVEALIDELPQLRKLGFKHVDQFYLKIIPDTVVFVFRHTTEPVYFCLYHLGSKKAMDIVSRYGNEFSITTNDKVDAGMVPRPAKSLLQIFPGVDYKTLFGNHMTAHYFLIGNGLRVHDLPVEEFRHYFMNCFYDQAKHIKSYFLWPVLLIFRTLARRGRQYCRSILEQYREGSIKLWD